MSRIVKTVFVLAAMLLVLSGPLANAQDAEQSYDKFLAERQELENKLAKRDEVVDRQLEEIKEYIKQLDDQKRRIEFCSSDPSPAARVVCYDEIARDYGFKTVDEMKTQEQRMEDHGFWIISKKVNEMGDEVITLKVDTVQPVISRSGMRRTPSFNIRCASKRTEVFLDWKSPLADHKVFIKTQSIKYKIDSERLMVEEWDLSQDNHAAFSPRAIDFVKILKGKSKLVLIVTAYGDQTSTLVFPLSGLNKALNVLVERCYNKKAEE